MTELRTRRLNLEPILDEPIDWRFKSFPPGPPVRIGDVASRGWNLLGGDFLMPAMVLKASALAHNHRVMAAFCESKGVSLAPHGKTSMAPQLFQAQLDAGSWAITAATAGHVRIYRAFGVDRVILANQLVEPAAVRWIAAELARDPGFEFACLVDSVAGVGILDAALAGMAAGRPLDVLLELGVAGGRTGSRTPAQALEVARAVAASRHLRLIGAEAFEGVIHEDRIEAAIGRVDTLLEEMRLTVVELDRLGLFDRAGEIVVTAGGSVFPDRVVAVLGREWELSRKVRLVLRSGCYVTHDAGHYHQLSPFGGRLPDSGALIEALEIWGAVLSLPEPGLGLLGFGKRDVAFDLGMPVPREVRSAGGSIRPLGVPARISGLNDQHAFLRLDGEAGLAVGDLVGCGISHPCTAFDKWRLIPVVDDDYRVIDAFLTYF